MCPLKISLQLLGKSALHVHLGTSLLSDNFLISRYLAPVCWCLILHVCQVRFSAINRFVLHKTSTSRIEFSCPRLLLFGVDMTVTLLSGKLHAGIYGMSHSLSTCSVLQRWVTAATAKWIRFYCTCKKLSW